jgi:radical SAM superfamily enzyme YgiQ (UPF0313 family)
MKKILFIDPGKVNESWYTVREMPSLALGCLATYLKYFRYEVKIIDMATYKIDNETLIKEIEKFQPEIIGITSSTFNVNSAFAAARAIKKYYPDIFIVFGGAHATALPEFSLKECPEIDAIITGEGEIALKKLCENPRRGVFREKQIENLDELPIVDWTLYDYNRYKKFYSLRFNQELHKYSLSIVRGCPSQCKFCFKIFKDPPRTRSPKNVFQEIEYNYYHLGARMFYLADSTALVFKENIHELCEMIINSPIKISLIVQSRVDTVDTKSIDLLKQAGCETFFMGVESGNDRILKLCGKNITKDQVRRAVRIVCASGIPRVRCSFIIGLESESRETIKETLKFTKELKSYGLNRASVHCLDIYPKTKYWDMVEKGEGNLRLRTKLYDWSVYSRLYPMTCCGDIPPDELKAYRDEGKMEFQEEL